MPRLRRSDCSSVGIERRRRGRGFQYLDAEGEPVEDPGTLERIDALGIPPAWREVWICLDPLGHLQATGIDAAGRKQYIYHERWRTHRDRQKFDAMVDFGRALPGMRRELARQLADPGLSRERVLACAVRMLDVGFFRIGSEDYAEHNESYGLATMLKRHVSLRESVVVFDYPAKSGQRRVQAIVDPHVVEVVSALKRRHGGEELLAYRSGRRWLDVRSHDINAYLKRLTGGDFSAKDFRTWNATVLAAVTLAVSHARAATHPATRGPATHPTTRGRATHPATRGRVSKDRAIREAIKTVAAFLGNTPAVCRASYVDPRVIDRFRAGVTIADALPRGDAPDLAKPRTRHQIERAVLDLLAG